MHRAILVGAENMSTRKKNKIEGVAFISKK